MIHNTRHAETAKDAKRTLGSWGQLLRVPNLFTVPGDPLAGFLLATAASTTGCWLYAALAAGAALVIYCGGLIDNDLADLEEDRRDRPSRPIPSGRVSVQAAGVARAAAMLAGVALAWAVSPACASVAAALGVVILLYNHATKKIRVIGPINMGLCRGLSVMLGASAWGWEGLAHPFAMVGAAVVTAYIAAVTAIAAGEMTGKPAGPRRNLPAAILAFSLAFFILPEFRHWMDNWPGVVSLLLCILAVGWATWCAIALGRAGAIIPKNIGRLIRGLIVIQAALASLSPAPEPGLIIAAALLLAALPLATIVSKRFYAS